MRLNNHYRGFSLVELLIAMTLGLLLTAGVLNLYLNSQSSFQAQQQLSQLQENAAFAGKYYQAAFNNAGYFDGCEPDNVPLNNLAQTAASPATPFDINFGYGVRGFEVVSGTASATLPTGAIADYDTNGDLVQITYLDPNESIKVNTHDLTNKTLSVTGTVSYVKGDVLVVIAPDCSLATVMVNETAPATPSTGTITYTAAASTSAKYLNCNLLHIQDDVDCTSTIPASPTPVEFTFPTGSSVYKVHKTLLALKQKTGVSTASLVEINLFTGSEIELMRGVSYVNLTYGISEKSAAYTITLAPSATATPTTFQRASRYLSATQIEANAAVQWSDVISVRADITLKSLAAINSSTTTQQAVRSFNYVFPIRNQMVR